LGPLQIYVSGVGTVEASTDVPAIRLKVLPEQTVLLLFAVAVNEDITGTE